MTKVFLARPVTHANTDEAAWTLALRDVLLSNGIGARLGGLSSAATDTEAAEHNIVSVTNASALVAVLPRSDDVTSSVWVEIGMALAASIPVLLVPGTGNRARLPFVVESLIGSALHSVVLIEGVSLQLVADQISHELQLLEKKNPR